MIFPLDFYDISIVILMGASMASLQDFHDVSIMFLWDYYGISISCSWYSVGFP